MDNVAVQIVTAIIAGVVGILSGAGGKDLYKFLTDSRRDANEQREKDSKRPIEEYKDIVDTLSERITIVEGQHRDCLKENGELRGQVGELRGRLIATENIIGKIAAETHTAAAASLIAQAQAVAGVKPSDSQIITVDNPLPVQVVKPPTANAPSQQDESSIHT